MFLDGARAGEAGAGRKRLAAIDRVFDRFCAKHDRATADGSRRRAEGEHGKLHDLARGAHGQAEVDEFDGFLRCGMAEALIVRGVEAVADGGGVGADEFVMLDRDGNGGIPARRSADP